MRASCDIKEGKPIPLLHAKSEVFMLRMSERLRAGRAVLLAVVGVLVLSSSALAGKGSSLNTGVVPISSGLYPNLSVEWWQWAYAQPVTPNNPATTNPLVDTTGVAAHNDQPAGNIFFLAGLIGSNTGLVASVERTITITSDKQLFFPLLNAESDNVSSPPTNFTVAQLRQFNDFFVSQVTSLYVTLDGIPLAIPNSFRVISPVFNYTLPPNNPPGSVNLYYYLTGGSFLVTGLQTPAVGDGFYVLLQPLTPGQHLLRFGGSTQTEDQFGNPALFSLNVTYHITVQAVH